MVLRVILLLALASTTLAWQSMPISLDSIEDGYQMIIKHDPWWNFEASDEDLGSSSYQYYYPYYAHKKVHTSYYRKRKPTYTRPLRQPSPRPTYTRPLRPPSKRPTYARPIRPQSPRPVPIQPSAPVQSDMSTREWPSWIPPVRLIKLPLDEPPAAID